MRSLRWGSVLVLLAATACGSGDGASDTETSHTEMSNTQVATTSVEPTSSSVEPAPPAPTTETTTTSPPSASTTTTTAEEPPTVTIEPPVMVDVKVYFLRDERLEIAHRRVEGPATLRGALTELLRGPTDDERAAGLVTAIPDDSRLLDVSLSDGQAIVDLSREYESGGGSLMMTARVAQVVFTATQFATSDRVRFWLDGAPLEYLGGEGIEVAEPLRRMDTERSLTGGVIVDAPEPGSAVHSPFVVTGEGDLFEGDSAAWVWRDGEPVAGPFLVTAGAWGEWRDFETSITLEISPGPFDLVMSDGDGCTPGDPECGDPLLTIVPLVLAP